LGNTEGKFEKFKTNYLDVPNEPLFPFGFGLSYTSFSYKNLRVSKDQFPKEDSITVSVEVTNTGNFDGKEVVQMYIRDLVGSTTRPVKELKGFEKVFIKKGETKTITFTVSEEDLKFYNYDLDFVAEPGEFEVFIGTDSTTQMKLDFLFV
jgi:beta-glucosidase